MALKKSVPVLLAQIFIVLPIVLEARFYHGYDSYKGFYRSHISSQHDHNDAKKEVTSHIRGEADADSKSNVIFPDHQQSIDVRVHSGNDRVEIRIGSVPVCEGQTFCEDVTNYPTEFVTRALAKDASLMHYMNTDRIDAAIAHRIDSIDEKSLCVSSERLIRPTSVRNINNEWLFIVQSEESNFTQAIRIETCEEEGSSCRLIDGFAEEYTTMCKQKFIYRQLLAISENDKIVRDFFQFPASCCCHVEFSVDISKR